MGRLDGNVAIVTGGSKGIGAGIACAMAAAGASVVVGYNADRTAAERIVTSIENSGGRAVAAMGDVSKAEDVAKLFTETIDAFGRVDIVVNNAGVYSFGGLEAFSPAEFHRQYDTNVLSVFLITQAAANAFGEDGGAVINVATAAVEGFNPGTALYTSSKAAVVAMTKVLAKELGPRGIRINAIAPGPTESAGFHALGLSGSTFVDQMVAATPLGRLGQLDDIAPVAVFLASDDARWITGEMILASGGYR